MTTRAFEDAVATYVRDVRQMRSQSAVLPEASLYAPLGEFLRACLGMFGRDTATVAAQARTTYGVPDFVVAEQNMPIGFIEAKRPGVDLARLRGHDKQQLEQFRNLENVLYTDYSAFRLYEHGELVASADLGGTEVLDTAGPSPTAARETELRDLLERFLSHAPTVPANASDLARLLARATRVLRDATAQLMSSDTKGQLSRERDRWRDLLFEDVNDSEFADAYAQTVVYGLLTARLDQPEGVLTLDGAGEALREHHAFLSAAFRTLTMAEIRQPLDWAVRVVLTVLQPVGLETFRRTRYADDPLLYFYEEFSAPTTRTCSRAAASTTRRRPSSTSRSVRWPMSRSALATSSCWRTTSSRWTRRWDRVRRYGYRPFSHTWLYDEYAFVDRPRPQLHALWFPGQQALVTLPKGHGPGPAAVLHTDLPDLHSFRGSYGGHVFPFWRDPDRTAPNLAPGTLAALGELYDTEVTVDDVFGHVVAVLTAPSYTLLFREGLAQGFPRVPFPVSATSFAASSALGRRLLPVLAMEPGSGAPVRLHGRPGPIRPGRFIGDRLYVSEAAWVAPVIESGWAHQVSGYRVLPRWLEYRKDLDLSRDLELVDELLATVGAIQRVVEMAPDLESNLEHLLAGDTVGRASVVPFDLATAARQLAAQANDEVAAEARLWDELSDEALRRSEGGS